MIILKVLAGVVFYALFFFLLYRGICGGDSDIMPWLENLIPPLVTAYRDLYQRQKNIARLQHGKKDEFFGLRDFYRCVV